MLVRIAHRETDPKALILFPSKDSTTASQLGVGRIAAAAAATAAATVQNESVATGINNSGSASSMDGGGGWTFVVLDGTCTNSVSFFPFFFRN